MKNRLYNKEINMTADEMIDSWNGFWVNGKPGVSDKFSRGLTENQKKMNGLILGAGSISPEDVCRLYEQSDKSTFLYTSSESLFAGLGRVNLEPRIA